MLPDSINYKFWVYSFIFQILYDHITFMITPAYSVYSSPCHFFKEKSKVDTLV